MSGIFFSCFHLAPLWNDFRASNGFLCSGKKYYVLYFLKLGWRGKYLCLHCAWCHSPFIQEAENLASIFSLREFDSKIPTSQKNLVTIKSVLLGQKNLHHSHWRWIRLSNDRSSQRSKRRANKKTTWSCAHLRRTCTGERGVPICQRALCTGSYSGET